MDNRRNETEFDEFEKLLGEIPKVTSGNDFNRFPISPSIRKAAQFEDQYLPHDLTFGIRENPHPLFIYHSTNTSPCGYDKLMFRKLQQVGYFPNPRLSPAHQPQPLSRYQSLGEEGNFQRLNLHEEKYSPLNPHCHYLCNNNHSMEHFGVWNKTDEDLALRLNNLALQPQKHSNSLAEARGKMYCMAKDQHGCRFLQRIFAEGDRDNIQTIFNEIVEYITELMVDPFGNYLVQKLLEVCNDDQRMQIIHSVTREPGVLVRISCDMHGTRTVQKIVETVKRRDEISITISALKHGIVTLIKNANGNHVVQRCLQFLLPYCGKFLFETVVTHCVELATDRHGCCVLQKCLGYFDGEQKQCLVSEIASNALLLSQHPFGNYVLQYVFELQHQWAINEILEQLGGNYTELSMQKCSSNVVEKCLKLADDKHRARIIRELINDGRFVQVLMDPYGNYVVQAALKQSKGNLHVHGLLVDAIKLRVSSLRTNPYGKKVLSALGLKK